MKICFISPNYYPSFIGGSEISEKLIAENLVRQGHMVTALSFDCEPGKPRIEKINGVKIIRYKNRFISALPLSLLIPVYWAMKRCEDSIDIFHVYNVSPTPGATLYKLLGGKRPVVVTLNNYEVICINGKMDCYGTRCRVNSKYSCLRYKAEKGPFFSAVYSLAFPLISQISMNADRYLALSNPVKQYYVNRGFDEEKITVIPNFYEPSEICYEDYSSRTQPNPFFNILYVGAMDYGKGVNVLIRAFYRLSLKNNNFRLILVGSGKRLDLYKKLTRELGISDKVTFKGKITDRAELISTYLCANVFVHPGRWPEPFGRTILEAMSVGLPLIVSNVGAPPEIVKTAGLTFNVNDAVDLARKIDAVFHDNSFANQLSQNCSQVMAEYNPAQIIPKIVEAYSLVLGKSDFL